MKLKKNDAKKNALWLNMMILLVVLASLTAIEICHSPIVDFAALLITNITALYFYQYRNHKLVRPVHFHWSNYLLGTFLLLAMLSMRIARSTGIEQSINWGIALLGIFLVLMAVLLITNWQGPFLSRSFHQKSVFYGVCGQYWMMYSTIFIGITYGISLYYWILVTYLLAMLFGPIFAKIIFKYISIDHIRLSLFLTMIGIVMTFWLPSYFFGVFLIRTFTNQVRQMSIREYEEKTNKYHLSYIVNYNYATAGGMTSQFVMWGSLLLLLRNEGLSQAFVNFSQHHSSLSNMAAINGAHLILAIYMILFTVSLWVSLKHLKN